MQITYSIERENNLVSYKKQFLTLHVKYIKLQNSEQISNFDNIK